jgi:hypothetical protein
MAITLEQLKTDLQGEENTSIFLSIDSFWWTHKKSDVVTSTAEQRENYIGKLNTEIENIREDAEKLRILESAKENANSLDLYFDVDGFPVIEIKDGISYIQAQETDNGLLKFGEGGINNLMKAHKENCNGNTFKTWQEYRNLE